MAEVLSRDTLKKRGVRARARAMDRAGGARISAAQWYPEIEYFEAQGLTQAQIGTALGMTERRVRQIKEQGHPSGAQLMKIIPEPTTLENMTPAHREMMPLTVEAYEKFFLEFSPFDEIVPLHRDWVGRIIEHRNVILNVPPRHAKSTTMMWFVLWLICRNRDEEIIWVSKSANLAIKFCRLVAYHLEYNAKLIEAFGRFAPESMGEVPWKPSSGQLLVVGRQREANAQFTLEARGSGQQILGTECTVAICDDITDVKTSKSELTRESHEDWLTGEVLSRIQPADKDDGPYRSASGRAVVLGQRVHLHDIYGFLIEQVFTRGPRKGEPLWEHIMYPAVLRWPDEDPENPEPLTLWPEVWDYEELMVTYERVGEKNFQCMYQQDPLPDGAAWVRQEWLEGCRDYQRSNSEGVRPDGVSELPIARVLSIDPSPTRYNALVVADVMSTRDNFGVVVIEFKTWIGGSREMRAEIERVLRHYRPDYLILESSTMTKWFEGEPWYQELRQRLTVIPHQTSRNKADAELGTESLAADLEAGRIRTPYQGKEARDMTSEFELQCIQYGHGFDYDLVMALWFIKWNWRKLRPASAFQGGFTVRKANANGFVKRARNTQVSEDKTVSQWRKRNGARQSA